MTKTIHLNLPPDLHAELKRIAAELDVAMTMLLKLLIRWWIKQIKEGRMRPEDILAASIDTETGSEGRAGKMGVKRGGESSPRDNGEDARMNELLLEKLLEIQQSIESMKKSFEDRLVDLESQIFELQDEIRKLKMRVHRLEDAYEDLVNPVHIEQVPAKR